MNKEIIKKTSIVALVLGMIGLAVFSIITSRANSAYKQEISARDNAAFYGFMNDLDKLNTSLSKLSVGADSSMNLQLLADVWRQAAEAEVSLTNINLSDEAKTLLSAFINRVSDYAQQLLLRVGRGNTLTQEDKDQIVGVKNTSASVYENLTKVWAAGYSSDVGVDAFSIDQDGSTLDFASQEYPTLIYDGAFSESLEDEPLNLSLPVVNAGEAMETAKEFMGIDLAYSSTTEGEQPYYTFSGESEGGSVEVYITKHGGLVLGFKVYTSGGLDILPTYTREQRLIATAREYLVEKGWPESESGYIQYYNGNAVINMVPLQDGVRIYPDIIKVSVNLSSSQVVGIDASNYIASHKERTIPAASVAAKDAEAQVGSLKITDSNLAMIPRDTGEEEFCYEFFCNDGTNDFIIYVDAEKGNVVDILQVIHINNGTLTK